MYKKIFINVLFEKKKFLIMFMLIFSFLLFFIGVQTMVQFSETNKVAIPNLEVLGKLDDDGLLRFKGYNDMDGVTAKLKELCGDEAKVYEVTSRNLLVMNNLFNKVSYQVYGVNNAFFKEQLEEHLKEGKLPEAGKKEAVLGSLAAKRYDVKVGDKINAPITLNKKSLKTDYMQYTVSGILADNEEYFWGNVFISKEEFEKNNEKSPENKILIYYTSKNSEKKVFNAYDQIKNQFSVGSTVSNNKEKNEAANSIIWNLVVILGVSLIIMLLLLSYLMKGITKKLGLLKALGLSDKYIVKNFVGGLFISSLISLASAFGGMVLIKNYLNKNMSEFLGYTVEHYLINSYSVLSVFFLWGVLLFIVFLIIKMKSWRISPRSAMLSS